MKVAVIGAGISGLACAHELERHGVIPDIFEQHSRSGELFTHCAVLLQIMHRPVKDLIKDLHERFHISIKPINPLKKITMYAPGNSGSVYGNLGYFVELGQAPGSVANQILSQVKTPVRFNTRADYSLLAREYDNVVVASGNSEAAKILGCWEDINSAWVMGATVLGSFDPYAMKMWVNTDYARQGYAYLTPFNSKSASLVLVVTGANRKNIGCFWNKFWQVENLKYEISALWDLQHISGFVYPHRVGNILLAGNSGGVLEPFLGFAMYSSIKSGIYAARSIVEGNSYEEYLEQIKENVRVSIAIRNTIDKYRNEDFGRLVKFLTTPGIKQIIYNTNLDMLKIAASLLGMKIKLELLKEK